MLFAFGLVVATVSLECLIYYLRATIPPTSVPSLLQTAGCVASIFMLNWAPFYLPIRAGAKRILIDGHVFLKRQKKFA